MGRHSRDDEPKNAGEELEKLQRENEETGTKICGIHGPYPARSGSCPRC